MKPHPRPLYIRKAIKWGCAATTVFLVVVWIGSGWWKPMWIETRAGDLEIDRGRVCFQSSDFLDYPTDWPQNAWPRGVMELPKFRIEWGVTIKIGGAKREIAIPLWMFALLAGAVTAFAWRLDTLARRRALLNLCPKCHYDRTGLTGGLGAVCPECGTPRV
jgi:hypothetical protein